ncbi:MAG: VWA domain-containing protein, partial [Acidobacteriota bacterium]|nr:VWA domain-containing protein [Acidobacteriota bacterium]
CAVLAFSAITNNDKVGLIIFSDRIEKFVPPRKGRHHVLRVLRELLYFKPAGRGTDVAGALEYLARVVRRRAVVFVVSDFLSTGYQKALAIAGRRHDTIVIRMSDPREHELPAVGYLELEDAETGELITVNASDPGFRRAFARDVTDRLATREREFRQTRVDVVEISTDRPYADRLMRFFRQRAKRFR